MFGLRIFYASTHLVAWTAAAAGEGFLASSGKSVTAASIEDVLLTEIHSNANNIQIGELQAALRPTYTTLPKNKHGQLESSTVRYALHRYFVQTFGWYVKGLEPDGFVWHNTSTEIMKDRVPAHIQHVLETRMEGRGLDLAGLAIFAATLTELIEKDITSNFDESYVALGFPKTGTIEAGDVDEAMRGYLAIHLFGSTEPVTDRARVKLIQKEIKRMYAAWPATNMWLRDTRIALEWSQQSRRNPFVVYNRTFETAVDAVHDIMHQFVTVANAECPALKTTLMQLELHGTGRIRLVDFYAKDQGQPRESKEYLQNLGCIDNSVPERPMMLIANYISSRANCIVDTSYYSTCCLNECEGLMAHIERSVMMPDVEPDRIADIVSNLPSDTVYAPRNLSETLLRRLGGIADRHGGRVPLHGRLFAQWMHHAYPRECPYPHPSGSTKQISQTEWIDSKNVDDVFATPEEIKETLETMAHWKKEHEAMTTDDFTWSTQEELVAAHWRTESPMFGSKDLCRLLVFGVALISMVVPLTRQFRSSSAACQGSQKYIHSV